MFSGRRSGDAGRRLVYSTGEGRICPGCGWPADRCACSRKAAPVSSDGVVRVGRQTKGRKGKEVTVVTGAPLEASALAGLARELKRRCGSGGTVKEGTIEIQGDHRDTVIAALAGRGWIIKRSGG